MNFCFNELKLQPEKIIQNKLMCEQRSNLLAQGNDLQQNMNKLIIPKSIVRLSSLSRITDSCKKINLNKQNFSKQLKNNQYGCKKQNQLKQIPQQNHNIKAIMQSNTKSIIVNKLLQKNQVLSKPSQNYNNKIQDDKNIKNKQNHNQKQSINFPVDKFYYKHQNVQKLIKIYKQKQEKELKQCTFNPKINTQNSSRNHDLKQFYEGQIQHCKKTQDKVQQMRLLIKAQKQKQNTFRPKISDQTRQLTQRRASQNVYERLYNQNKEQKLRQLQCQYYKNQQKKIVRQPSKKSISLVSSSKKTNQINQSSQKDKNNANQEQNSLTYNKSYELKRQNSLRTFSSMMNKNQSKTLFSVQKTKSNNPLHSKRKANQSKKPSAQNTQKKLNFQTLNTQLLDCRQLLKQKQQQNHLSREQSCKLIPSISKQLSYRDKLSKDKQCHRNKQNSLSKNKVSQKNQKIALQRFVKEFLVVVQKTGLNKQISFTQMLGLLKNMNFIQSLDYLYQQKPDSQLKKKIFQIWTILQGQEGQQILLINLFKILSAIQGFNNNHMIQQSIKTILESFNMNNLNLLQSGKTLVLSEKDSKAIKKDFMNFYLTRFKLGESKLFAKQHSGNNYSFRPSVSKQSQQYAQKYRERILAQSEKLISEGAIDFTVPQNGMIDHSMLLILDKKIKDYKMQQKRLQVQRQRRKQQDQSMAQHSLTNRSINQTIVTERNKNYSKQQELNSNVFSRISHNQSYSKSKDQIFADLYQNGRKSRQSKRDRSKDQIQYQEMKDQLTFKPKINDNRQKIYKQTNSNVNLRENIPNFTKQVMRMRKNRNIKDDMSISPLLYLNVTMQGNEQTKIPVFDSDNLQSITQKVRVMMKIQNGQQQRKKLKNILKEQIIPVLDQLGMKQKQGKFLR